MRSCGSTCTGRSRYLRAIRISGPVDFCHFVRTRNCKPLPNQTTKVFVSGGPAPHRPVPAFAKGGLGLYRALHRGASRLGSVLELWNDLLGHVGRSWAGFACFAYLVCLARSDAKSQVEALMALEFFLGTSYLTYGYQITTVGTRRLLSQR